VHTVTSVVALVDGDHHPAAVADALRTLGERYAVRAAVFCGGEEKLSPEVLASPERHYGVEVAIGADPASLLRRVAARHGDVTAVIDLADDPVLGAAAKLELACVAIDLGLRYLGADFEFEPPAYESFDFAGRRIAVIGTGKRVGKTAVCGHLAGLLRDRGKRPLIVAMGRGGPAEPQLALPGTSTADLLAIARAGRHAASDYLEDAVIAGVPTVGCRRVGGGLAGASVESNVLAGVRLALAQSPGTLLFEGSGSAVPPVEVDATVCVVGGREGALDHLGPVRLLRSELVLVAGDDPRLADDVRRWCAGFVLPIKLIPEPLAPLPAGARVAFFTTGPGSLADAEPVVLSRNLARRAALSADLERAARERCDVYVAELKAAAVDTVAEAAERAGARIVWARNRPVSRDAASDLDEALLEIGR
jgi:cyclic 2,3-diphosphoglycerate synthetase